MGEGVGFGALERHDELVDSGVGVGFPTVGGLRRGVRSDLAKCVGYVEVGGHLDSNGGKD